MILLVKSFISLAQKILRLQCNDLRVESIVFCRAENIVAAAQSYIFNDNVDSHMKQISTMSKTKSVHRNYGTICAYAGVERVIMQ